MAKELKRELNLLHIFCLASGAMISSGIFILPGLAYKEAGPLVFISYFLAGILALIGTLSIIELATAMPKAGGDYFFITRSLGPMVGTVSSFLSWAALCLKSAFAVFGIAEILYLTFGIPLIISSFFICLFFIILNIAGIKEAAKFEVVLVIALFAIMFFLIAGGFGRLSVSHFSPLIPHGFNRVLITSGFVFISFGGLLNIASISGEVKNPTKNIPRGMMLSILAVTVFYAAILIVVVGVLPNDQLTGSLTPIADTGEILFGKAGYIVISIGALLAFITTANAGIISASRYPLALSEDKLLPAVISRLTKKKKAPAIAIAITGFFIFISLLLQLEDLVKLGSVVILTLYILTNIAVIVLREGRLQNYKPAFKIPFYPWTNIVSIILFLFLIIDMGLVAVEISIFLLFAAFMVYFLYGRKRHRIEFALLHLVERVINKKITDNTLESELKSVIISRDEIIIDRFHKLVENSTILDIKNKTGFNYFLNILADSVSGEIGLDKKEIIRLFNEREEESSTVISPFVAIPHIIIPGSNRFKLAVVRCKEGIEFEGENASIKAVFVLFGTKDERSFHLKALSAIAQIIQNPHFEKAWLSAKDKNQLKDIILLSERHRF